MLKEKEDIILLIRDQYLKYGIKSVSMDDAAKTCGISKKTLYQYFKDKANLVENVISYSIQLNTELVDAIISSENDAVTEMYDIHVFLNKLTIEHSHVVDYDLKKYYPRVHDLIIKTKRDRIFNISFNNLIKGKKEGYYRPEINEEIIAKIALLRHESSIDTCLFTNEEIQSKDFFKELFIYHIRGISTEKGIKKIKEVLKNNKL